MLNPIIGKCQLKWYHRDCKIKDKSIYIRERQKGDTINMKIIFRNIGIMAVFACFVLLLALSYKGKYVQAENKKAAKAEASTLDEYGNRVEATHITIENTSPFELKNVQVKFNGEKTVKNISVKKDGKATVKLPKTDKPITKVEIEGTTSYGKKFTNFFSGCISNKSCIVVYLTETMDLGVTANIE